MIFPGGKKLRGIDLGKVSDALEKARDQSAPSGQDESTGSSVGRVEEKKTIALNTRSIPAAKDVVSASIDASERDLPKTAQWQEEKPSKQVRIANRNNRPLFDEKRIDHNLVAYSLPHSYEAEQFRMLRTNVLFPKNGRPARSILIASTAPSEGKSFVASNLAISIAQNVDKYVLLIDCDMRKPSLHHLFGFGPIPGLSDYLTHGQSLSSLIQNTFIDRLSLLPGGAPPSNPAELLSSGRMADLLKEVSQRYKDRFVIIDSPPVQLTAESKALAKFAQGILLVTRLGKTDTKLALEVADKVGREKIIGVVGNFADRKGIYKSYADKYSGYYGRYQKSS